MLDLSELLVTLSLSMFLLVTTCIIIIELIDRYLILHHRIDFIPHESSNENFNVTNGIDSNIINNGKLNVISECNNESLNDMHHRNIGNVDNGKNMCETKELNHQDANKYLQSLKLPQTYTADTPKQGVIGSNYMMYNNNPSPYYSDYPLFAKNEPKNTPVGVNYWTIV